MTTARRPSREKVLDDATRRLAGWSGRLLLIVAALVVVGIIIGQLWSITLPVFLGLLIATVFEPAATRLRGWGWPPLAATSLVFLVAVGVLTGVVAAIVPTVSEQSPALVDGAVRGIEQVQAFLGGPPFNLGTTQIGQAVQVAVERLQQNATAIAGGLVTGVSAVASGLINLVLALVVAFLFVKDGPRFLPWLARRSGPTAGAHLSAIGARTWSRLGGFIRSQAIIGLVDAVFIGIGLAVLGVPLALPLSVLTFFGAFIPIIGALVAGAFAVLVALVFNGLTTALIVLALILVVQQVEGNLLQPVIQGRGLGLHAAVVILAVTAGGSIFGIAGAFFAVPVAAVGAEILRYLNEQIDVLADGPPAVDPPATEASDTGPAADEPADGTVPAGDTVPADGGKAATPDDVRPGPT